MHYSSGTAMTEAPGTMTSPRSRAQWSFLLPLLICLQMVGGLLVVASIIRPLSIAQAPARVAVVPGSLPVALDRPPPVLPMVVVKLAPDDARASNAAVPIDLTAPATARPFVFAGTKDDRARALICLAATEYYEAGDDRIGEQAVAQVVLNRLRHPAFPKSVCGVVLQGSDRTTGCQFTYTCDGSLVRVPDPAAWKRAMALAEEALSGSVFKPVGLATHYHTDWVVPYWRDSLDKIAQVHTHVFYRWRGWWGTPPAFAGRSFVGEDLGPRLAGLGPPELTPTPGIAPEVLAEAKAPPPVPAALPKSLVAEGVAQSELRGNAIQLMDAKAGRYFLHLDPAAYPGSYAITAFAMCRVRPSCEVSGWTQAEMMPTTLPILPVSQSAMTFHFVKTSMADPGVAHWNCRQVRRDRSEQCLPGTREPVLAAATPPPNGPRPQ
jgi:hypothetical protein